MGHFSEIPPGPSPRSHQLFPAQPSAEDTSHLLCTRRSPGSFHLFGKEELHIALHQQKKNKVKIRKSPKVLPGRAPRRHRHRARRTHHDGKAPVTATAYAGASGTSQGKTKPKQRFLLKLVDFRESLGWPVQPARARGCCSKPAGSDLDNEAPPRRPVPLRQPGQKPLTFSTLHCTVVYFGCFFFNVFIGSPRSCPRCCHSHCARLRARAAFASRVFLSAAL